MTDQFVKTRSEFEKFQKIIKRSMHLTIIKLLLGLNFIYGKLLSNAQD